MAETPTGWALLHSQLPKAAIKPIPEAVYNVKGLSDVNEGYLIQRLFAANLDWEWRLHPHQYLGHEDRESQAGKSYRVYMFSVQGVLTVGGRDFHGAGASDNRKLDAAIKGASTVAFKQACKLAGLTIELFKDGRAMDFLYADEKLNKQATVEDLVKQIDETFPVQEAASSDKRQEVNDGAPKDGLLEDVGGQTPVVAVTSPPPESGEIDLSDLFSLARTLKEPRTNLVVTNRVAKVGVAATRRELILAHARDHGIACEHVAELAGMAK